MIDDIIGGVSPLKARQSSRGGKNAGKATSTGKRRGGFAKSSGKRGAGGRNVGGYNVNTRFKVDKWNPPASGGTMSAGSPKPKDPVTKKDGGKAVTPGGNTTINNEINQNSIYIRVVYIVQIVKVLQDLGIMKMCLGTKQLRQVV